MNKQNYIEVRDHAGRDSAKALAFFFVGLPVAIILGAFILL